MKTLSIILFLTLSCSKVFCQQQTNPSSSALKNTGIRSGKQQNKKCRQRSGSILVDATPKWDQRS